MEIEGAAFLSSMAGPATPPDVLDIEGEALFAGSFEAALVRERVSIALYAALAQAQAATAEIGNDILFLKIPGNTV